MDLAAFRYYTSWHRAANARRYDAPADPWRLLPVDPGDVEYYTNELRLNWGLGRVQGGDWDREEHRHPIRETTTYRGLRQRFEEGYDWEETDLYRWASERFEDGETVRGYESIEAYRDVRCEYVDELYHTIREEGYRPNEAATHEKASEDNPWEDAYANHLEPLVVVGRDGDVYWTEGFHRFAIASLLDLDAVPVYVLCRHAEWQSVRDRVHGTPAGELPADHRSHLGHPDLADVRP